ncbi:hypothetical protein TNCV_1820821 [Trichonephila clavipes]|nr:hypothetical protein TNCV_1820821 [Trichonephila clavipes]
MLFTRCNAIAISRDSMYRYRSCCTSKMTLVMNYAVNCRGTTSCDTISFCKEKGSLKDPSISLEQRRCSLAVRSLMTNSNGSRDSDFSRSP